MLINIVRKVESYSMDELTPEDVDVLLSALDLYATKGGKNKSTARDLYNDLMACTDHEVELL